ncbi:MAG: zinc-ribbon domain-containing protein [Gemmatimonadaceae bacterium]|nr:zinc-ribbon domain-containing protein [Gemmatimonadaceae bacterium]
MNVTCPECRSIFRVDPSKVPTTGIRARCSVCGGVITIAALAATIDPIPAVAPAPVSAPAAAPAAPRVSTPARAFLESDAEAAPEPTYDEPTPLERAYTPSAAVESVTPPAAAPAAPVAPARPSTPVFTAPVVPVVTPTARPSVPPLPPPMPAGPPARPTAAPTPPRPSFLSPSAPATPRPSVATPPVGGAPAAPPPRPTMPAMPRASSPAVPPMAPPMPRASAPIVSPSAPTPVIPTPAVGGEAPAKRPINPFLANDPNQKAKRLARALVSDMVAYLPQKREEGLRDGTLKQLFREEIKKSYEEYVDQVGKEFAESTAHFQDALNDVLAGGKKMF